ncbi:MAG TPA: hypothetical protein VHW25_10220 [Steroidobacteraceae bacterium]|nr:hypothetical protein [Steroidobacteraceae bacterium]
MTPASPTVNYWHLYTDSAGVTHQRRCVMTEFELKSISPPAAPQWQGRPSRGDMSVLVMVLPIGWVGEWHENPKPQWIVPLSGRWFVESMDGMRVEMAAGEISFGADQHSQETDARRGHRSGTVGDAPAVLMVIQFNEAREASSPCAVS